MVHKIKDSDYSEKIIECIDKHFPKGDKKRGNALVLQAVAFIEGKEQGTKKANMKGLENLYELWNNLDDDLTLDLKEGESGYKTHKKSYIAVKKYTVKVLSKQIKELKKKLKI